jgi:hypothetical protein
MSITARNDAKTAIGTICPLMRRPLDTDEPVSIGLFVTQTRHSRIAGRAPCEPSKNGRATRMINRGLVRPFADWSSSDFENKAASTQSSPRHCDSAIGHTSPLPFSRKSQPNRVNVQRE